MKKNELQHWPAAVIATLLSLVGSYFIDRVFGTGDHFLFGVICTISLIVISWFIIRFASSSVQHADKTAFVRIFLASVMIKLALAVLLVIGYRALIEPDGRTYLFQFIWVYLVFLVMETKILMAISRSVD